MIERLSLVWFAVAGGVLMLFATALALTGLYDVVVATLRNDGTLPSKLLSSIGYVVIAVAVFDVAKYILEEEVVRERELRNVAEVRRSLTRFIATILIAVFLEAIVATFKVANDRIDLIAYPALLLFVGVTMLVGLAVFQRLTASVEQDVGAKDDADEDGVPDIAEAAVAARKPKKGNATA